MSVPDLNLALLVLCENLNLVRDPLLSVLSTATLSLVVYNVVSRICTGSPLDTLCFIPSVGLWLLILDLPLLLSLLL